MTYLVQPSWIGFDGQPITGVIPPRLRLMSGVMTPALASEVAHRYKIFHTNKQASRAEYFVTDTDLPDGSRLRIVANGRIEDVLVWSVAKGNPEDGEGVALAYPVVPLPSYAPIFDRYVFDRVYTPPPPESYPPEPVFESTIPPPITEETLVEYTITESSQLEQLGEFSYRQTVITTSTILGSVYVHTTQSTYDFGTLVSGSNSGTLLVVKSEPAGQPNVWPKVLFDAETWTILPGGGVEVQTIPALEALKEAGLAAAEAAYLQYQAAVTAEYADWLASTYAAWVAACAAVDQANADRVISIDATAESISLRKAGRGDQVAAYNEWIDGGISDRHVTWAMFDAPAMTKSKPVMPVIFTDGSGPLDGAWFDSDVGSYFAVYLLNKANRETPLGDGSSGGPQS